MWGAAVHGRQVGDARGGLKEGVEGVVAALGGTAAPLGRGLGVVAGRERVEEAHEQLAGEDVEGAAQEPKPVDAALQVELAAGVAGALRQVLIIGAVGVDAVDDSLHRPAQRLRLGDAGDRGERFVGVGELLGACGGALRGHGAHVLPGDRALFERGAQLGQRGEALGGVEQRDGVLGVEVGAVAQPRRRRHGGVLAVQAAPGQLGEHPQVHPRCAVGLAVQRDGGVGDRDVGLLGELQRRPGVGDEPPGLDHVGEPAEVQAPLTQLVQGHRPGRRGLGLSRGLGGGLGRADARCPVGGRVIPGALLCG
jgi:hypothetical protein